MRVRNAGAGRVSVCTVLAAAGGAGLVLAGASPALGQAGGRDRFGSRPMLIGAVATQHVTHNGFSRGPFPSFMDCVVTSAHTDHPFQSGTNANLQAGKAEGEIAAVVFTAPAASFPIKLNTAEILWGKWGASSTTIEWSVQVWEGTPTNGTLVAHESSDGTILPHATIPAGANALHMTFSVDPNDPDQIIINDNGTQTFTLGFKIDQLQNASTPCTPDPFSDGFPMTDLSGLASPSGNLIFANAACPSTCPSGWSSFGSLGSNCRPTGDWVIRMTWEALNCTPATGACCLAGQTCQVLTQAACTAQSGVYQGDNTACTACPSATGACCFGGSCVNLSEADCATASGVYQGNGSSCASGNCPVGACCLPDGTCASVTASACTAQSGVFQGAGSQCGGVSCPQPPGACCVNGGCLTLTQADCSVIPNATWSGPNTTCGSGICNATPCYANCDGSTQTPVLNVADFTCFLQRFAGGESYANCDQSTTPPVLNVADFTCFLQAFAAACP